MNICRICEQFPPIKGGLSSGMLDLSMAQYKKGHQLTIITRWCENAEEFDKDLPFKVIRLKASKIMFFGWKAWSIMKKLPEKPDIVHTHGPAAAACTFRRKKNDPPIVHSVHAVRKYQYGLFNDLPKLVSDFEHKAGGKVLKKPNSYNFFLPTIQKELLLDKYIFRNVNHLLVVAEYFGRQIQHYYNISAEKITVSYNGSSFKAEQKDDSGQVGVGEITVEPDDRVILYTGRVDWVKRVHLLVEAMPEVLTKYPTAKLVIAGTGDQFADLKCLINKMNLKDAVIMPGWVEHNIVRQLLYRTDCFCLPSYWEGLSKSLIEATSVEVPVVVTNNLSNKEITQNGKYGWLVDEPTAENWAEVICKVLGGGNEVEAKTNAALSLLDKKYRWKHVAERLDSVYEELVKSLN